jgi:hypothetical protein
MVNTATIKPFLDSDGNAMNLPPWIFSQSNFFCGCHLIITIVHNLASIPRIMRQQQQRIGKLGQG